MKMLAFAIAVSIALITLVANPGYGDRAFGFLRYVPGGDTTGHFGLYGLLGFAVTAAALRAARTTTRSLGIRVTLLLALVITLEEFSQAVIPTRTCSFQDLAASLAGLLVGSFAALRLVVPHTASGVA